MKKLATLISTLLICSIFVTGCGKVTTSNKKAGQSREPLPTSQINAPSQTNPALVTPIPTEAAIDKEQGYNDAERNISILGLKEYNKIKGKDFTDKAKKNKKYLVLFLRMRNRSVESDYFHPDYLSAKLDGKNISHTFLVNEPEGYPTMFTNIESGETAAGFIVWEIPKNWKKFTISYKGWEGKSGLTLQAEFTKKDLRNPTKYEKVIYS